MFRKEKNVVSFLLAVCSDSEKMGEKHSDNDDALRCKRTERSLFSDQLIKLGSGLVHCKKKLFVTLIRSPKWSSGQSDHTNWPFLLRENGRDHACPVRARYLARETKSLQWQSWDILYVNYKVYIVFIPFVLMLYLISFTCFTYLFTSKNGRI